MKRLTRQRLRWGSARRPESASVGLLVVACFLAFAPVGHAQTTYFSDGFESGLGNWVVSGSDWAIVSSAAVSPTHAATDSPGGNYASDANASMTMASRVNLTAATAPVLTFWHQIDLSREYFSCGEDAAVVEISSDGGFNWTAVKSYGCSAWGWTPEWISLQAYAGARIQVRFRIYNNGDNNVGDGWTIDDVRIAEQDASNLAYPFTDSFEAGLSNWLASGSDWAVIDTAFASPGHSVTDSPNASYPSNSNASLTLAHPVNLAGATTPILSFWHQVDLSREYFSCGEDAAVVEASSDGGVTWSTLKSYNCSAWGWTPEWISLQAYVGKRVLVRFRVRNNLDGNVADGWTIDNVRIAEQDASNLPYPFGDNFEGGLANWRVSGSDWAAVDTASVSAGHAATDSPDVPYPWNSNASLTLAHPVNLAGATKPVLTFWHQLDLSREYFSCGEDVAVVEASSDGGLSWSTLKSYQCNAWGWTPEWVPLQDYIGQRLLVRFRVRNNLDGNVGAGWTVDDVRIAEQDAANLPYPFVDDFEQGLSNWLVSGSDWAPTSVYAVSPGQSVTDSAGNYPWDSNASLTLSHPIDLTGASTPVLYYWHRGAFSTEYFSCGEDRAFAEVSTDGGASWTVVKNYGCGVWSWMREQVPLASYVGARILVRFRVRNNLDNNVADGWYIDDVEVSDLDGPTTTTTTGPTTTTSSSTSSSSTSSTSTSHPSSTTSLPATTSTSSSTTSTSKPSASSSTSTSSSTTSSTSSTTIGACPSFTDDFESGSLSQWTTVGRQQGSGTVSVVNRGGSKVAQIDHRYFTEIGLQHVVPYHPDLIVDFDVEATVSSEPPPAPDYYASAGVSVGFLDASNTTLGYVQYLTATTSFVFGVLGPDPAREGIQLTAGPQHVHVTAQELLALITIDPSKIAKLSIAAQSYGSTNPYPSVSGTVWLDDVSIGCTPPTTTTTTTTTTSTSTTTTTIPVCGNGFIEDGEDCEPGRGGCVGNAPCKDDCQCPGNSCHDLPDSEACNDLDDCTDDDTCHARVCSGVEKCRVELPFQTPVDPENPTVPLTVVAAPELESAFCTAKLFKAKGAFNLTRAAVDRPPDPLPGIRDGKSLSRAAKGTMSATGRLVLNVRLNPVARRVLDKKGHIDAVAKVTIKEKNGRKRLLRQLLTLVR